MQLEYQKRGLTVRVEGSNQKEVFKQLAAFEEVFTETVCKKCGGSDTRFVVRNVEDNDFYEMRCENLNCRAKLEFGQHKKGGTLFPKRKDDEGNFLPDNGWTVWMPDGATPAPAKTAKKTVKK